MFHAIIREILLPDTVNKKATPTFMMEENNLDLHAAMKFLSTT